MLKGLTQREFQELNLSVGKTTRARRPLSPLEVADLCAKAIDNGVGRTELTRALKMTDTGMVSKFLRLREIVPEVRHLVSWGYSGDAAIGFSVAAQLARLPLDKQAAAAEAIVKHRLTRDQMISVIQLLERSKQTLAECINRVLSRNPVVRVRQFILGAITSAKTRSKLSSLSQLKRDELLEGVVTRLFPKAKDFTAKLGTERFAIIGGKSIAETVATESQVEKKINGCLEDELK